jgi:tetratricopeptide (TPR) repeat protein
MRWTCSIWRLHKRSMRPEMQSGRLVVLLLAGAVFASYANAFRGVFQFDDFNVIVNNLRVHGWPAWLHDLQHGIRPLLKFSYTFDWMTGQGVAAFHLSNILIHLCNTLLVWLLSRHFIAAYPALRHKQYIALLTALLFAVHPVHSEAVTYISGRSIALMTLFYLAGLLAYILGRSQQRSVYLHVLTPLCMLLALGVKETAVTFPAALLLWEIFSGGNLKSAWRLQWSSWLLLGASAIFFLLHDGYGRLVQNSVQLNDFSGNVATQILAFVYLLRQWFFPLWLNIDPDLPVLHNFNGLLPHMLILTLLAGLMLWSWRRRPWLSFALAWTFLQLLPLYFFLPRMDVANERQLYLVSWPLALAVVAELSLWLKAKMFIAISAGLLVLLASLTLLRNQQYHSEIALWEATAKVSPAKARVQNNLGYAYMLAGRNAEARLAFSKALYLDPNYYQSHFNLQRLMSLD